MSLPAYQQASYKMGGIRDVARGTQILKAKPRSFIRSSLRQRQGTREQFQRRELVAQAEGHGRVTGTGLCWPLHCSWFPCAMISSLWGFQGRGEGFSSRIGWLPGTMSEWQSVSVWTHQTFLSMKARRICQLVSEKSVMGLERGKRHGMSWQHRQTLGWRLASSRTQSLLSY